jgi:zinc protease
MTVNRLLEPSIEIPETIAVPKASKHILKNGIPCFSIHSPSQDVLKIEFIFEAGLLFEPARLVAAATNELSDDGTKLKTAKQIAEHFDFYGASIQAECGSDRSSIILFTLGKFLHETLPVVHEIIRSATFPDEELNTWKTQQIQRLSVNNKKVEFVGRKIFTEKIFGPTHPYGYYATEADFIKLDHSMLADFHSKAYQHNFTVLVSGNITGNVFKELDAVFGTDENQVIIKNNFSGATNGAEKASPVYREKADALQSAVWIGRKLFNKTHSDFFGMSILNTILGGYFGSRLMTNIREDKGYTYGIGSAVVSMQQGGYFFIATEVGEAVTNETLKEIYAEIRRLQEEPVGKEELKTVKNYLTGAFLRSIDGPFAQADKWKGIYFYNLDYDYYDRYLETLKNITGNDIQQLAIKYLNTNELTEVVVGKK